METDTQFLDSETITNKSFFEGIKEMVVCVICTGVIIDPMQCISCENSFCKHCIGIWGNKSSCCPFKCANFVTKDGTRMIKNLLEKLLMKCPYDCSKSEDFSYENMIKHLNNCEKIKVNCPCCDTLVTKNSLKETEEVKKLKSEIKKIEEENETLKLINSELQEELKKYRDTSPSMRLHNSLSQSQQLIRHNLPFSYKEIQKEQETGLIDKCEHFKGNYKPIFICCNKAFPCYICHNEKQSHTYQFSNKVVCLHCNNIYTGTQCSQCNAIQVYQKK